MGTIVAGGWWQLHSQSQERHLGSSPFHISIQHEYMNMSNEAPADYTAESNYLLEEIAKLTVS